MANVTTKSKAKNAASKKPKRRRDGGDLKEQVLSMGGEISDLNLLKDVEGGDAVVTGEQENDVRFYFIYLNSLLRI